MSILHEIWLCELCKYDPETIYKYIDFFGSAKAAYSAKASKYKKSEYFSHLSKIFKADKSLDSAKKLVDECKRKDIHIMSFDDDDYPIYLKNGYCPPRVLFIKGERFNFNDHLVITIIGSRASTRHGRMMANQLARDLVRSGCIVVSGMAEGIDTDAQKGALEAGGKTFALLAGGVDVVYPAENRELYENIIKNGAVISERPPGTVGRNYFYQHRNRIMAGLAHGIVVVEGARVSGTSITVKHATDASRDIFAVPGSPMVAQSELPNDLIKAGSTPVMGFEDIIHTYEDLYPNLLENGKKLLKHQDDALTLEFDYALDGEDTKIIEYLKSCGDAQLPDDISEACNIPIHRVSGKLTVLLINGIVIQEPGNKYLLIRR